MILIPLARPIPVTLLMPTKILQLYLYLYIATNTKVNVNVSVSASPSVSASVSVSDSVSVSVRDRAMVRVRLNIHLTVLTLSVLYAFVRAWLASSHPSARCKGLEAASRGDRYSSDLLCLTLINLLTLCLTHCVPHFAHCATSTLG